jgi:hypothetical protein
MGKARRYERLFSEFDFEYSHCMTALFYLGSGIFSFILFSSFFEGEGGGMGKKVRQGRTSDNFREQSAFLVLFLAFHFVYPVSQPATPAQPSPAQLSRVESKPMKRGVLRLHAYSYTYISIVHRTEHNTAIYHNRATKCHRREGLQPSQQTPAVIMISFRTDLGPQFQVDQSIKQVGR